MLPASVLTKITMYYISIAAFVLMDMHMEIDGLEILSQEKRMQYFIVVGAVSRSSCTTEYAQYVYSGLSRGLDAV